MHFWPRAQRTLWLVAVLAVRCVHFNLTQNSGPSRPLASGQSLPMKLIVVPGDNLQRRRPNRARQRAGRWRRAFPHAPERIRSKVCKLNEEKVVNPPHRPTMANSRVFSETAKRPLARVNDPKNPITRAPSTLISIVPHGKLLLQPKVQRVRLYRARPPRALPTTTQRYAMMRYPRLSKGPSLHHAGCFEL